MIEQPNTNRLTALRACVLLVAVAVAGPAMTVALMTAGLSLIPAAVVAVLIFTCTAPFVWGLLPASLPAGRGVRLLFLAWLMLCGFVALRMGKHSVFMYDVGRTEFAFDAPIRSLDDPELTKPFYVKHNCYTSYIIGAHLASQRVRNIYESDQYRDPEIETDIHNTIGDALTIDRYQYPPPFLLLPRLMLASGDFFKSRTYWYALNVGIICLAVVLLSAWVGGRSFGVAWFALPIVLIAPVTTSSLQIGNVHLLIICISILAMLAFEHRRFAVGGVLLGFAVISKLFPGLLLAYLVVTRRWRAVAWTCAFMVGLTGATLLVFGLEPFRAFFEYQAPRLASGEAFSFSWEKIRPLAANLSVMGVAHKLSRLDLLGELDPIAVAKVLSLVFTIVLAAGLLAIGIGDFARRRTERAPSESNTATHLEALAWLAILIVAELRSPFLPWGYANLPILWLLTLLLAQRWWRPAKHVVLLALIVGFAVNIPLFFGPPTVTFDLWYTVAAFLVILTICMSIMGVRALRRTGSPGGGASRPILASS
ncbi:MAG: glycosyltransferase family 87 protein [Phycisphaerae bacterium]|jgi:hypothetical protein